MGNPIRRRPDGSWDDLALIKLRERFHEAQGEDTPCTCQTCPLERTCTATWDVYNTDGDCIMDK